MPKPISFNQTPEPWFLNAIQVCNRKGHIVAVCYIVNTFECITARCAQKISDFLYRFLSLDSKFKSICVHEMDSDIYTINVLDKL